MDEGFDAEIGENVTVGHGTILHGCAIGDGTLIGMGSTILNGAKIGRNCLIGAGSLVTQNAVIPDGSMAFGPCVPCKAAVCQGVLAADQGGAVLFRRGGAAHGA